MDRVPVIRVAQRTMAVLLATERDFNHKDERKWPDRITVVAYWKERGITVYPSRLLDQPTPEVAAKVNELLSKCVARKPGAGDRPWTLEEMFKAEFDTMHVGV